MQKEVLQLYKLKQICSKEFGWDFTSEDERLIASLPSDLDLNPVLVSFWFGFEGGNQMLETLGFFTAFLHSLLLLRFADISRGFHFSIFRGNTYGRCDLCHVALTDAVH